MKDKIWRPLFYPSSFPPCPFCLSKRFSLRLISASIRLRRCKTRRIWRRILAPNCAFCTSRNPRDNVHYLAPYAPNPTDMVAYHDQARQRAEDNLHNIIARLHTSVETRPLLREGRPADEIVGAARDEGADLLVISTHGIGGWRHLMFGSVAEKVIRLAPCPVMVTHAQKPQETPTNP